MKIYLTIFQNNWIYLRAIQDWVDDDLQALKESQENAIHRK
jgi:hypothetical protein